jgi:formamidopyrimidine-DNA glycosylase
MLARDRAIKALLLDQGVVAGLGNIYVDEILWAARVHPLARAGALRPERVAEAHRHLRRVLAAAIRAGGSTLRDYRDADGAPGTYLREHKVYGRAGEPCVRCGSRVRRTLAAGRSTHWCPRCQRAPRARAS